MTDYRALTEPAEISAYIQECIGAPLVGIDSETTGLRKWQDTIVGICLAHTPGNAVYIPLTHERGPNADLAWFADELRALLLHGRLAFHGGAFDIPFFARLLDVDPWLVNVTHDTMLAAQCIGQRAEAGSSGSAGLKALAKQFLGVERADFQDLWPPKTKPEAKKFAKLDLDVAVPYAAADADDTLNLVAALMPRVDAAQVRFIYEQVEIPLLPEFMWMEARGLLIDHAYAQRKSMDAARYAEEVEQAIFRRLSEMFGRPIAINLNSGDKLAALLFDPQPEGLGMPVLKKTPGGKRSVDAATIEKLAAYEPTLSWLVQARGALKVKSTYLDAIDDFCVDEPDAGRVLHPSYKQFGTETGRTASSDPNIQNWPKEQEFSLPPEVDVEPFTVNARDLAIARPGYYLLDADWAQVEYKVTGGLSQEPALLDLFERGVDLHIGTASRMWNVPIEQVTPKQRQMAKTANYLIAFSGGPGRLAASMGIPFSEAKEIINRYWQGYPHVAQKRAETEEFAQRYGYVQTVFGRKRWLVFGGGNVSEEGARKARFAALREAVNMPVQGSAADLLKITLVRLGPWLRAYFPDIRTIATTHDSITFEVPERYDPVVLKEQLRPVVEFPKGFIPGWPAITADFGWGQAWGSLKDHSAKAEPETPAPVPEPVYVEDAPQTLVLVVHEAPSRETLTAFGQLMQTIPGRNAIEITFPNLGGKTWRIPNVGLTEDEGYLLAHLFESFTLRRKGALVTTALAEALA